MQAQPKEKKKKTHYKNERDIRCFNKLFFYKVKENFPVESVPLFFTRPAFAITPVVPRTQGRTAEPCYL